MGRPITLALAALILVASTPISVYRAAAAPPGEVLPGPKQARIVTVTPRGHAAREIAILTEAVAVKETGPKATVQTFGEVYAWAPSFVAVRRDEPVKITFWNLQPDDDHDFELQDPKGRPLMHVLLQPLAKTSFVFTFHETGIFPFLCLLHQPEMSGQILVVAPQRRREAGGGKGAR